MPSRRRRDGSFHDVAHPINQDLREHIESTVLDYYYQIQGKPESASEESVESSRL